MGGPVRGQFTGIPYYPQFGRYIAKRSLKGGFHIIIPGEPVAAMAALGVAGVIWALRQAQGDGGSGQAAFGWAQASGNPYLADLPGMFERMCNVLGATCEVGEKKKSLVSSFKVLEKEQPETRDQKLETLHTEISGIAGQEPNTAAAKAGKYILTKGWHFIKKHFM